jgi:hypothetical protein
LSPTLGLDIGTGQNSSPHIVNQTRQKVPFRKHWKKRVNFFTINCHQHWGWISAIAKKFHHILSSTLGLDICNCQNYSPNIVNQTRQKVPFRKHWKKKNILSLAEYLQKKSWELPNICRPVIHSASVYVSV